MYLLFEQLNSWLKSKVIKLKKLNNILLSSHLSTAMVCIAKSTTGVQSDLSWKGSRWDEVIFSTEGLTSQVTSPRAHL